MRIGISYNLAPPRSSHSDSGPDDRYEEFDRPDTIEAIAAAIRSEGHEVILLGDGREFCTRVLACPPDFVFNIAEGEGIGRCREARVPATLELLGVPYSGSDPLTLAACLDKDMARKLVQANSDVVCPQAWYLDWNRPNDRATLNSLFSGPDFSSPGGGWGRSKPLIFKPALEGSSKGIRGHCVPETREEAIEICTTLSRDYRQPIQVEEYIEGDEVTVGLLGNGDPSEADAFEVYAMRIAPQHPTTRFVYSLEMKRDWENQVTYEAPPRIFDPLLRSIVAAALKVFHALQCRDLARIDFRVRDGIPYFIEANPLPGLAPRTSDLVIMAERYAINHPTLIRKILKTALTRVGLA